MNRDEWFSKKFLYLKRFFFAAMVGAALLYFSDTEAPIIAVIGVILCVPFFIWILMVPIFHWKDRYIGGKSGIWGFFLVFETTSWTKVLYWFMHVIPDWRKSGKYRNVN